MSLHLNTSLTLQVQGSTAVSAEDEGRARAIANFVNIVRNHKEPLATAEELMSGPCQRDDTRLVDSLPIHKIVQSEIIVL